MSDQEDLPTRPVQTAQSYNALALRPGHEILDYKVQSTLGGGGFGITYLARDVNLNLPVAIKEYMPVDLAVRGTDHSVSANNEQAESQFNWGLERFLDEARTLATFRHPNIVRVLRYFKANGTAYIVMEYESGESLKHWLPRHTPVDCPTLLALINPLLEGLELIHKAGFLHRDIKPDNIYIRRDGTPVLLDFGAARRISTGQDLTTVISPGFAPFEQYHAHGNQGPWTDLYSMAAVMYWVISGEKPLDAAARFKHDGMLAAAHIDQHQIYDTSFLEALDWALAPDETKRPQKVEDFHSRINALIISDPTQLRTPQHTLLHAPTNTGTHTARPANFSQTDTRRNMVCTVMFLDIANYSTYSVNEQFALKCEFNQLLANKLATIPESTRITLDTGDGASICFMGDPEDVLLIAIDVQRTLQRQQHLQVRIGLHIGPVRVLKDINSRENVIGDGLNAAQRIMRFASPNEIMVSRAYYDVVSCLSDNTSARFTHIGEQHDQQGRSHDLYRISDVSTDPKDERTIPLGAANRGNDITAIDGAALQSIEKELTRLIGPLASILVRKASLIAKSADEMRSLLAQGLSDETQRQTFLSGTNRHSKTNSSLGPSQRTPSHVNSGNTSVAPPTWLDEKTAALLERQLTHAIGPMARVVIKRELRQAKDLTQLRQALALQIDNPEARTQFLSAVPHA